MIADVAALPSVNAVSGVRGLPTLIQSNGAYQVEGRSTIQVQGIHSPQALFTVITPDYFRTLKVGLKSGRDFADGDTRGATFVAIINESLARTAFPGEDPLGRRIQCGLDSFEFMTIVGVVSDIRTRGPVTPAEAEIYMPYQQHPGPATTMNIVVRADAADPLTLADTITRKIRARNPDVPVRATTMEGTLETARATARFNTYLLVLFGSIALVLALAGITA
ncbi:MAG: ABC transporter permease [Vicinamibacterales bacterium]